VCLFPTKTSNAIARRIDLIRLFIWLAGSYLDIEQPLLLYVASFAPVTREPFTSFVLLSETLNETVTFRYFSCTICRPMCVSV